jgi:Predicted membrane protein
LGGVVGVGTVIAAFLPGPVIQFCLPYGERVVNLLLGNEEQNKR